MYNLDFKNGNRLGFPIGRILDNTDLQVALIQPCLGKKHKIHFQYGSHCGHRRFLIGMILVISDL